MAPNPSFFVAARHPDAPVTLTPLTPNGYADMIRFVELPLRREAGEHLVHRVLPADLSGG